MAAFYALAQSFHLTVLRIDAVYGNHRHVGDEKVSREKKGQHQKKDDSHDQFPCWFFRGFIFFDIFASLADMSV